MLIKTRFGSFFAILSSLSLAACGGGSGDASNSGSS